jgi:cysteine-rich repeat protein
MRGSRKSRIVCLIAAVLLVWVGSRTAVLAVCGDATVDVGETCDDGSTDDCGTCNADCTGLGTGSVCGDSVVCPETEACDDGSESATCNADCIPATCGDGTVNATAGEACDDGNLVAGDGCDPTCHVGPVSGIIATIAGGGFSGVAFDPTGRIAFSDAGRQRVMRLEPDGSTSVIAGSDVPGFDGDTGPASLASLDSPGAIVFDADGSLYVADRGNYRIRKVTATGTITTVAGTGTPSYSGDGGPGVAATLIGADALAVDAAGNLYIADAISNRVRKLTTSGQISTFAGTGVAGTSGDGGPATLAQLSAPVGLAADNGGTVYILQVDGKIRGVAPEGTISTLIGAWACCGQTGATSLAWAGDRLVATRSEWAGGSVVEISLGGQITREWPISLCNYDPLCTPYAIAADANGRTVVVDHRVRGVWEVNPNSSETYPPDGFVPVVETVEVGNGDGGPALAATLSVPSGVAVGPDGGLLITDWTQGVRRIRPDGNIETVVAFRWGEYPIAAASDLAGGFYVGYVVIDDSTSPVIRHVQSGGSSEDIFVPSSGGGATVVRFLAIDQSQTLYYIHEPPSSAPELRWRKPDGTSGTVDPSGTYCCGLAFDSQGRLYVGSGGQILRGEPLGDGAWQFAPYAPITPDGGMAIDLEGRLYVGGASNGRVSRVNVDGTIENFAGLGIWGFGGDLGPAMLARFALDTTQSMAVPVGQFLDTDADGRVYVIDGVNGRLRVVYPRHAIDTPASANVVVNEPGNGIQVTYAQVAIPGVTLFTRLPSRPGARKSGFQIAGADLAFDVTATARASGLTEVCVRYAEGVDETSLRFLHEEGGAFVDRTSSIDIASNRLCGQVTSFSRMDGGIGTESCGNGSVESGEQCDDGNTVACDGCSAGCKVEGGLVCGDGIINVVCGEECDNGNTGGGCSAICKLTCGNGNVDPGEQCDDGNIIDGDGCDSNCTVTRCGNGIVTHGEECDDGNLVDSDGCQSNCTLPGVCGDGVVDAGEQCDDGNTTNGDCCSATCQFESGPCDDASVCTTNDTCDGAGSCVGSAAPADRCRPSLKASLKIIEGADPTRRQVQFAWRGASAFSDFGDPNATTDYTLCVYDQSGSVVGMTAPAASSCGTQPCWSVREGSSVQYKDRRRPPVNDGVEQVNGRADDGVAGKANLKVKGKGEKIPTINMSAPLAAPVKAQVVTSDADCWEAEFQLGDEKRNDGEKYKATVKNTP